MCLLHEKMKDYFDFEHSKYHYCSAPPRLQPGPGHLWLFVQLNLLPWIMSGAYLAMDGRGAIAAGFITAQRTINELDL